MKNENENVEIIEDDEIVTLYDDDNQPVDFYEVAVVEYEDDYYALLEPVEEMEGIEEGEVLIFKLEEQDDGTDMFIPVDDEELLNAVFEEYLRTAEDGCGCGCEDCEDECEHEHHCHCDCDDCKHE